MSARFRRIETAVAFVALGLFVTYFGLHCFKYVWRGDIQRHCAAVASLYKDFLHPPHEAVAAPGTTSEVHTPYIVAVAALGRMLHVTPYRALQLVGVLNLILYVWAVRIFFRTFSVAGDSWIPPLFFLLVSLCMRERLYSWASEASFINLRVIQAYPSMFGWGLALVMFALAQRSARRIGKSVVLLAALIWVLLLSHNITGSWVIGIIGVIGLLELVESRGSKEAARRVLLLFAATAAGIALTYFWPYFDISRSPGLLLFPEGSEFADHPLRDMAPLYVLAAIAAVWLVRLRHHQFFFAGFAATALVLIVCRYVGFSYGNRYAFFQAFFAQAAVAEMAAIGLLHLCRQRVLPERLRLRGGPAWLSPAFAAAVILLSLTSQTMRHLRMAGFARLLTRPSAHDLYYQRLGSLSSRLGRQDVVIMPVSYSNWDVASITGARVVVAPFAYRLPDFAKRLEDVNRYLDPATDSRSRGDIIERYGVSKVLLTPGYMELAGKLGPYEEAETWEGRWMLFDAAHTAR
jgi:hypothetical protein